MAFGLIKKSVQYVNKKNKSLKKKIQFSITTNGSLIDDTVLDFLVKNRFSILISFDGRAQDLVRKGGSHDRIYSVLEKVLKKNKTKLSTNSVFTPKTVGLLSESIKSIIRVGVPNIFFKLSSTSQWNESLLQMYERELQSLSEYSLDLYQETKKIPLMGFRKNSGEGLFVCSAGKDRLSLSCDGILWGCHLFSDYYKAKKKSQEYHDFCFGKIEEFIAKYKTICYERAWHYRWLRMDFFHTTSLKCSKCENLMECGVCPIDAALTSSVIGKIPEWKCQSKKIFMKEKKLFWEAIQPDINH